MDNIKCKVCGGSMIINTDTGLCICDSCGNTVEADSEAVKKYQNLLTAADRKMMYNSVKYYTEAIEILEDIPFVSGAKEKADLCRRRIAEIKSAQAEKEKQIKNTDSKDSKAGIIIALCIILGLIVIASTAGIIIFKLVKGSLSSGEVYVCAAVIAVAVGVFVAAKIKGN